MHLVSHVLIVEVAEVVVLLLLNFLSKDARLSLCLRHSFVSLGNFLSVCCLVDELVALEKALPFLINLLRFGFAPDRNLALASV